MLIILERKISTAQKMKFSIKDFFSKCDLRIWSRLLKKSLMENFIFCAVFVFQTDFRLVYHKSAK